MKNHKISVSEALQKLDAGEPVSDFSIDFQGIKVEALEVMKLSKGGIAVPENAIYYNDEDIQPDEDFEGDWVRGVAPTELKTKVTILLKSDLKQWVDENNVQLGELLSNLLDGFFRAQKMVAARP